MSIPRAPSYLNSRLLGCVTIGYKEPRTHYLGHWEPERITMARKSCSRKRPRLFLERAP